MLMQLYSPMNLRQFTDEKVLLLSSLMRRTRQRNLSLRVHWRIFLKSCPQCKRDTIPLKVLFGLQS